MKLSILGVGVLIGTLAFSVQTGFAQVPGQTTQIVKVLGCLQGDGSDQKPWIISGVALPPPPAAAPAGGAGGGAPGGGAPGGGGRGGGGGAGRGGGGAGAPAGGPPAGGGAPAAGAPGGAAAGAGGQGGRGGGAGRGGGGRGGGGGAAVPAVPAPSVQLVDLRPTGGMNMAPWRGMKIEVEGTLGPKPANGPQEIRLTSARSVQGVCTPK